MICERIDHLLDQDLNPHQGYKAADGDVRSIALLVHADGDNSGFNANVT
jgi:hypothetical protein